MKDVEVGRRHNRVTQRVLLYEKARIGARFGLVPGSPFVDIQTHLLVRRAAEPPLFEVRHDGVLILDEAVHLECVCQCVDPSGFVKACSRVLVFPARSQDCVVVKRDRIHSAARVLHQFSGEVCLVVVAAGCQQFRHCAGPRLHEGGVLVVNVRVVLRSHVSAAPPGLVANSVYRDLPRQFAAVGLALLYQRGVPIAGHVFKPLGCFLRRTGADVRVHISLGADHLDKIEKLICAEGVVFRHSAPIGVDANRSLVHRADAVAPVIFVGKAAARPANHRDLQLL